MAKAPRHCAYCGASTHNRRTCPNGLTRKQCCAKCGKTLPVQAFEYYQHLNPRGYIDLEVPTWCKVCQELYGPNCSSCGNKGHREDRCPNPGTANGLYRCAMCDGMFPIDEMRTKHGKPVSYCKVCDSKRQKERRYTSLHLFILYTYHNTSASAKRHNLAFDLSVEFLETLFAQQEGRCYYSGMPLKFDKGDFAISVDQKVPRLGYTKENVVLCGWLLNRMKTDMDQDRFVEMCRTVADRFKKTSNSPTKD